MKAQPMLSPRILIADDQPHILDALHILLKNEGFLPSVVTSPRAVIDALEKGTYDILLIDLNYARDTTSGSEGLELLARIREIDDALPVVVMTAWGSVELAVEALQCGGRDFVQKPWDNAKLLSILRRQLEQGELLRQKQRQEKASKWLLREMNEAREIQQRLMPSEMPQIRDCEIQAVWIPASDVGGDYFDAIRLSDTRMAFCMADVSGKGLPAALLMSNTQATVRAFARTTNSPSDMCRQLNRVLSENIAAGKFITMFYAILDTAKCHLVYSNAGHLPPLLVHADGTCAPLKSQGMVLGVRKDSQYEDMEMDLRSGDRLVVFTDGISETCSATEEEFGLDRLLTIIKNNRQRSALELQKIILSAVLEFGHQRLPDDATLMIIALD